MGPLKLDELEDEIVVILTINCKSIDNKSGVKIDESRFTLVDFRKIGYRDEPFIMVQQAS